MADVVILGCLFIFLLINACNGGLLGLVEPETDTHSSGTDLQLVEDKESLQKMMVHQPRYKCHLCEPPECEPGATCADALFCYKASVRDAAGALRHSRGCSAAADHAQFTCRHRAPGVRKRHASQLNVSCCAGDLCNAGAWPALAEPAGAARAPWPALAAAAAALAAAAAAAVLLLRRAHRLRVSRAALRKLGADPNYFSSNVCSPQVTSAYYEGAEGSQTGGLKATAAGDSTLREYLQDSVSSGSGSGLPLMVQRTLSKQVALLNCVGKGRYGEVWRGLWYADSVAVKIFFSRDEASWRRETEIYSTVLLRHANILAYIGSDMTSRNSCTQLWLITHFHPLGSLHDHLARHTLTRHEMMVICVSIVNGLLHLHTDIHGTQGKPAIAHRDIKSKNILVKSDGECCIADFGLAVTAAMAARGDAGRRGTARYMAPELLDESMDERCLEAHRRCDVYALALVLWEVRRRAAPASEPREPYAGLVPAEPGRELMRKVVCGDGARPALPPAERDPVSIAEPGRELMRKVVCGDGARPALPPAERDPVSIAEPGRELMRKVVCGDGARPALPPAERDPVSIAEPGRELMRKVVCGDGARPALPPAERDPVSIAEPGRELMRKVVCGDGARPALPPAERDPVSIAEPGRELMRKVVCGDGARPALPPAERDPVSIAEPGRELMRKVVCGDGARPALPPAERDPVSIAEPGRELMRKVVCGDGARPALPPAERDPVSIAEPGRELMRKVVCGDGARPALPPAERDPVSIAEPGRELMRKTMAGLSQLMRECWHARAAVRLPALRVKKTLLRLAAADPAVRLAPDGQLA